MNKKVFLIILLLFSFITIDIAQEFGLKYNTKKWEHMIGVGIIGGNYKGIPPSRSEINYYKKGNQPAPDDRNYLLGIAFDGKISRRFKRNAIGIEWDYWNNFDRYEYSYFETDSRKMMGDTAIRHISYAEHAYTNLGIFYERELYKNKSGKLRLNTSATAGISINHTPDRTEYDYYEDGFIIWDTTTTKINGKDSINAFILTSTGFDTGWFLSSSVNAKYNLTPQSGIMLELGFCKQFHSLYWEGKGKHYPKSAANTIPIPDDVNLSNNPDGGYQVNIWQLKIAYFF